MGNDRCQVASHGGGVKVLLKSCGAKRHYQWRIRKALSPDAIPHPVIVTDHDQINGKGGDWCNRTYPASDERTMKAPTHGLHSLVDAYQT